MRIAILTSDNRERFKDYNHPTPYFGTAPEALLQGFAELCDTEVHIISCLQKPAPAPAKITDNLWFHGLHVPKIGWLRTGYQGCIRTTRKRIKEIEPAIVHGQGTERDCAVSAVFSGFPNVLTIHGNMRRIARMNKVRPFSFLWLMARMEGLALPRAGGVICLSRHTRSEVERVARRTWVVPNAVDKQMFDVSACPPSGQPSTILCVANILALKNQNGLIRALDPLAKQREFKLVFLGLALDNDAYAGEFRNMVSSRPWCVYEGFVNKQQLIAHLRTASALALPTLEENCPMVVLEAMAAGVPVMAANVGGVPDLIEDGKNGLLCDPLDATSMRAGVERLLADRGLGLRLSQYAKEGAKAKFHPAVIARRHLEIYREVLQMRNQKGRIKKDSVPIAAN